MPIRQLLGTDFFADPTVLASVSGTIEVANRAFAELFGLSPEALAGKQLANLAILSSAAIEEYLLACARSERVLSRSLDFRRRRQIIPFRAHGVAFPPRSAPQGSQVLISLRAMREAARGTEPQPVFLDAPREHRQEIEDSLRRQSQILEVTLASIGDAVIVTDTEARVTFLNGVAESLTEWIAEDARNQPLMKVFPIVNERTRQPVHNPVERVLRTGMIAGLANHTMLLSRSGREIPIDDSAAPIRLPNGQLFGVVLIFRDVSHQRQAERATAWLSAIIESSEDAIISKSLDGKITSWNPAAERLFGYSAQEIIGWPLMTIVPPELQAEESDILARLRRGERVEHFDTVRVGKDQRRIEVSLTISPVKDDEGAVVGASKIARDIRKRREAERMLREADQRKDEFLAALGHELRDPLGILRNVLETLSHSPRSSSELGPALEMLNRQAGILTRLADDLLDMGRISSGRLHLQSEHLELGTLLRDTVASVRHVYDAKSQLLALEVPSGSLTVFGDRTRLTQLFSNLLHNASKYTGAGGRVQVQLRREGTNSAVSVRDNGAGISPEMLDRVFELFVQVRESDGRTGEGLGIGLSLARRLATMHGGSIEARSEGEGRGSEFVVRLPISEQQVGGG